MNKQNSSLTGGEIINHQHEHNYIAYSLTCFTNTVNDFLKRKNTLRDEMMVAHCLGLLAHYNTPETIATTLPEMVINLYNRERVIDEMEYYGRGEEYEV